MDKQGAHPSVSDQAGFEKLDGGSKSPEIMGKRLPIPGPCPTMVLLP